MKIDRSIFQSAPKKVQDAAYIHIGKKFFRYNTKSVFEYLKILNDAEQNGFGRHHANGFVNVKDEHLKKKVSGVLTAFYEQAYELVWFYVTNLPKGD